MVIEIVLHTRCPIRCSATVFRHINNKKLELAVTLRLVVKLSTAQYRAVPEHACPTH